MVSFIHEQHKNDTELSKYILELTSAHKVLTIKWCIVRKIHGNAKSDFCKLCLTEKYFMLSISSILYSITVLPLFFQVK